MAIPPDPIDTVLPDATAGAVAKVAKVLVQDPQEPLPKASKPGVTDKGGKVARQVVELTVTEVLFGGLKVGASLEAEKPAGAYTLSPGNGGPFLLAPGAAAGKWRILGRYGPDTYPVDLIKARLQKHGKK